MKIANRRSEQQIEGDNNKLETDKRQNECMLENYNKEVNSKLRAVNFKLEGSKHLILESSNQQIDRGKQ
jgi:hypothetical protein